MNSTRHAITLVFTFLLSSTLLRGGDAPEERVVPVAAYSYDLDHPKHGGRIVELLSKSGIEATIQNREKQTGTIRVAPGDAAAARKVIAAAIETEKLDVRLVSEIPLSITIAIPETYGARVISYWNEKSHFNVVVTNPTDTPVHLWSEGCSWGYYSLTFEITDKSGKMRSVRKKPIAWSRNFPQFEVLGPQESSVFDVYFSDAEIWTGFPRPKNGTEVVTMRAIFTNDSDEDTKKHNVWTGRLATKPMKYTFEHWKQK
jgi:hypothetical protein